MGYSDLPISVHSRHESFAPVDLCSQQGSRRFERRVIKEHRWGYFKSALRRESLRKLDCGQRIQANRHERYIRVKESAHHEPCNRTHHVRNRHPRLNCLYFHIHSRRRRHLLLHRILGRDHLFVVKSAEDVDLAKVNYGSGMYLRPMILCDFLNL